MRRLLLLRHAKAAPVQGRDDHGRGLTERGRADARDVAEAIATRGAHPGVVLHSSAARTRETAEIVASRWTNRPSLLAEHALYDASRTMIFMLARGLPDNDEVAMIVGHNPGIGDLANLLVGAGAEADRVHMAAKYPTSGLAILDFSVAKWEEIAPREGRLMHFLTPAGPGLERD